MIIETEFRKFKNEVRREMADLKKIIITRLATDRWIQQDVACVLLNVKPRRLRDIRKHIKGDKTVGFISWKKGKGRNVLYYKPDIEKYNSEFTIMN